MAERGEIVAQLEGEPGPATHIRGTLIINSMTTLRSANKVDAYWSHLPAQHHNDMHAVTVQSWVPMELAVVHYTALGKVFVDAAEQLQNGRVAFERTQNSHVSTVLRTLGSAGALDMWSVLGRVPGLVARSFQGGQTVIRRVGPKDARIEFIGFPLFRVSYLHYSFQGTYQAALELVTRRVHVRQDLPFRRAERMALLVSWV